MAAVVDGVIGSLSDLEAYNRAVMFYFQLQHTGNILFHSLLIFVSLKILIFFVQLLQCLLLPAHTSAAFLIDSDNVVNAFIIPASTERKSPFLT